MSSRSAWFPRFFLRTGPLALAGALAVGCPPAPSTGGSDSSVDSAGGPSGGGGGSDLDCDGEFSVDAPAGPDCLSGTISCGDTIEATTEGGAQALDELLYESAYCFVPFESYAGPERVYELMVPEWTVATVTLDSPCGDLGLAAIRWSDTETCPVGNAHNIGECDGSAAGSSGEATLYADDSEIRYIVAVDGADAAPFSLSVSCAE